MIDHYADFFASGQDGAMPVVAETFDGMLNDINALHVTPVHALQAISAARGGFVEKGSSGGGNGMIAYEFKGGTGTASRKVPLAGQDHTVGGLVQANHGRRPWLSILGRPVGRLMPEGAWRDREVGAIIVYIGTDAPLSALSLRHLARRAAIGIGRGGTPSGNSSGDIFLAFAVAIPGPMPQGAGPLLSRPELNTEGLDPVYLASVEAVEEAVVNAMVAGVDVDALNPGGQTVRVIDTASGAHAAPRGATVPLAPLGGHPCTVSRRAMSGYHAP